MTISTAIALSAFFMMLAPALYKLAELCTELVRIRRLKVEDDVARMLKRLRENADFVNAAMGRSADTIADLKERIETLQQRVTNLNNRVVAGVRKSS